VSFGSRHMHERILAAWQRAAARGGGVILPGFFILHGGGERWWSTGLGDNGPSTSSLRRPSRGASIPAWQKAAGPLGLSIALC